MDQFWLSLAGIVCIICILAFMARNKQQRSNR